MNSISTSINGLENFIAGASSVKLPLLESGTIKILKWVWRGIGDIGRKTVKKINKRARKKYSENPEPKSKAARKHRLKTFGLTPELWKEIYDRQEGKCAICKCPSNLCVDHDHLTGEVRGLLCTGCNVALGGFKDSVPILKSAIIYLTRLFIS